MWVAVVILGFLIVGAVVGTALNFAGVFLAIPFTLIGIGLILGREQMERARRVQQLHRFRAAARARQTQFTEADKRTVV